jgi:hypothetical protein
MTKQSNKMRIKNGNITFCGGCERTTDGFNLINKCPAITCAITMLMEHNCTTHINRSVYIWQHVIAAVFHEQFFAQ